MTTSEQKHEAVYLMGQLVDQKGNPASQAKYFPLPWHTLWQGKVVDTH